MEHGGWKVKCESCAYARTFGENKIACMCAAAKHMAVRQHTTVTMYLGEFERHTPSMDILDSTMEPPY